MKSEVFLKPAIGAVLTTFCGLVLLTPLGERWENASYDYLFRFCARVPTNQVVLILMDNAAYTHFNVGRANPLDWKREWHADLLDKLAKDGCPLVVLDVFLKSASHFAANSDLALADAIRRQGHVILAARLEDPEFPGIEIITPKPPYDLFRNAAAGWGVGEVERSPDKIVRRHWPTPAPHSSISSLAWEAARFAGARLSDKPHKQWLRYYAEEAAWKTMSYHLAASSSPGYFHDKTVFIGRDPETTELGDENEDEFGTPHTRWTHRSEGGVKIIATTFLNLINDDWLRRLPWWVEAFALGLTGALLGFGLCQIALGKPFGLGRMGMTFGVAFLAGLAVMLSAVSGSCLTNFWFPWLVIAGGQVPCAFAWTLICAVVSTRSPEPPVPAPPAPCSESDIPTDCDRPAVHGYDYLTNYPFGEGAFGKVWIVRNVIGEAQALKAVFQRKTGEDSWSYEAEFKAIQKYKPVSNNHPGLLHISHVDVASKPDGTGYFYYVMELGDSLSPDWERSPASYKPRNLASERAQAPGRRLSVRQCVEILLPLAEALDFLHRQGLTHRDIKPENIVFVHGRPKLADVGLVTNIRSAEQTGSRPGTPGYMPPSPEQVGTVAADIYGLGMVLYVISTGQKPATFPVLSATLADGPAHADFMRLNAVIVKACQPDLVERYASAAEMRAALTEIQAALGPVT